ncbi:MAG: hypothetical protein LBQ02_02165 [Candidatus Nomurabacteria bacterium]|jgi:hypothetical protein|nr:hypothetical protein [Candidatus Nomurabacteria bacterium]
MVDIKATKTTNETSELEKALAGIDGNKGDGGAAVGAPLDFQEAPVPTVDDILSGKDATTAPVAAPAGSLKSIKNSVLSDLKPLVGKVNLPADERFELLMQIFEVTKDTGLIEQAYAAAKDIADDTIKAEALLRVIREIDNIG